ncbi:BlaI/MecI/CopY family transcriptional regulator [Membranihabitans maritimus]|uniref:BlaI/MecI/CopY family transcriptional regulator n=1 Tax=Membranihabitans maritimus TaxID=2904244 RepID=UPI001F43E7A3|nr:BlaI/MecI/CopY family transcriptional regulator [Membranihabitans maritimus]
MKLSKSEEQLMEYIWQAEQIFMKDLIEAYPEPRPAPSTIATMLKRMQEKGYVGYKLFGNSRQYHPLVDKKDYFRNHVKGLIRNFFNNSSVQFASFFTKNTDLTEEELNDLKDLIDQQLMNKKNDSLYK